MNTFTLTFTGRRPVAWLVWLTPLLLALAAIPLHGESPTPNTPQPDARAGAAATSLRTPADPRLQGFLSRLGVDRWHRAGFRGRGVKVAVLDSSFRGYRSLLGKTLPAQVTAQSFRQDGNIEGKDMDHGVRCAEVIHALAPDAELLFVNWEPDSPESFLKAVQWARQQGARVLSCSLIMPSWSDGEGGGPTHKALAQLVGRGDRAGDMLCFASAGNLAERHWGGKFLDDGQGFHQWLPGRAGNALTPTGTERVSVELYGPPGADYALYVYDGPTLIGLGRTPEGQGPGGSGAVVRFYPQRQRHYQVRVRLLHGPAGTFHVVALGGALGIATPHGSICFPADGREVAAMGAVDRHGRRMNYSCCGPNSPQPKPDFVAAVPFPLGVRRLPFGGTSAAAPQGAALAALWLSRHPDWTARQAYAAMRHSARDLGPPGHDDETGYGMVLVPAPAARTEASGPPASVIHSTSLKK